MNLGTLVSRWSVDGTLGVAFVVLTAAAAGLYAGAAALGTRRDRRARRWPRQRTACFMAGLALLIVDLDSGIGTTADTRLAAHTVEHMVMWLVVAPLLAAGAPVRLALFALGRDGRRRLAGWLHARPVRLLTSPAGSVTVFAAVLAVTQMPAVFGLALRDDTAHEAEHALYLASALLIWAPLIGADPLPHRPGPRTSAACMGACMVPMAAVALWLLTASSAVYGHYPGTLGPAALHDQRVAGAIMLVAGLPAFAVAPVARLRAPGARRARALAGGQVAA